MSRRSTLRASDQDRESIADRLRTAAAEGRLMAHELEDRVATALRARTYGELDSLVSDIPGTVERRRASGLRPWIAPAIGLAIAIPIAIAVLVMLAFIVTGVLALWGLWLFVGWWVFGRRMRPRHYRPREPRRRQDLPRRPDLTGSQRTAQPRPGYWL